MSQVWLRFERKKKDGTVLKLKIQDLPPDRIGVATELMVKYFARDEPLRKAIGFIENPEALEEYKDYAYKTFGDPATRNVMCCADNNDDHPVIMGLSSVAVVSGAFWDLQYTWKDNKPSPITINLDTCFASLRDVAGTAITRAMCPHKVTPDSIHYLGSGKGTEETKKMNDFFADTLEEFDVLKKFNITSFYADKSLLVLPEYRGCGIAEKFLTVRRMMCAAHGIPLTAAWFSNHGTQIAAARDGWKTYHELDYGKLSRKHGLTFQDVPPTIKLVAAELHPDFSPPSTLN